VKFSHCGRYIASGSFDKGVRLWDLTTQKEIAHLSEHELSVSDVSWSNESNEVLSGAFDRSAKVWDVTTSNCLSSFSVSSGFIQAVMFNPSGTSPSLLHYLLLLLLLTFLIFLKITIPSSLEQLKSKYTVSIEELQKAFSLLTTKLWLTRCKLSLSCLLTCLHFPSHFFLSHLVTFFEMDVISCQEIQEDLLRLGILGAEEWFPSSKTTKLTNPSLTFISHLQEETEKKVVIWESTLMITFSEFTTEEKNILQPLPPLPPLPPLLPLPVQLQLHLQLLVLQHPQFHPLFLLQRSLETQIY
jgi:hypothetical protein